jgi:adenine phosphoribosyltransferase
MMAKKAMLFNDVESYNMIMYADNPRDQKAFGRRVKGFDKDKWEAVCREYVYEGNYAKFTQNPKMCEELLSSGNLEIVEASPEDKIWGIGLHESDPRVHDKSQWQGTNWLGEAIMRVRTELNNSGFERHMTLTNKLKSTVRDVANFPKEGILFKDITPVFADAQLCSELVEELAQGIIRSGEQIHAIAGIESRGFFFGFLLANKLGIPFIPIRKAGKLPFTTVSIEYALEYGTAKIEMNSDAVTEGMRVLIHDDLLATGGTAAAAAELIQRQGGEVAGFNFLINLAFLNGSENLIKHSNNITSIIEY